MKSSKAKAWPAVTAAAVSLAYLSTPSSYYNFDGVACAIAVELGDLSRLAHGNHLAYGLLGLLFDRSWRLLGYQGQAILALQALDSLLGGLGAGLFCRLLLRRLACPPAAAVAASLGLSFSYAYWFWSLEAQVYLLGIVFMILAADEALADSPRPRVVGFWQACAVLGHVGHLMFAPAALWLLASGPLRWKSLRSYAAALTVTVAAAYLLAGLFCLHPRGFPDIRLWLLGSAALKLGGEFFWLTGSSLTGNIRDWSLTTFRVFSDAQALSGWSRITAAVFSSAALLTAAAAARQGSRPARAALIWLGGYALLFILWQPFNIVYHVSDLVPLWLLIALAARQSRAKTALLGALAAALAVFNATFLVLPFSSAGRNTAYQEALFIRKIAPEEAWIITSSIGQVYVPYFAHRKPLNMRYFQEPGALEARLRQLQAAGQTVLVPSSLLAEDSAARVRLEAYGLEETAREGGFVLRRVMLRKENPAEGVKKS